ncbi:hypothetical protein NtB2_00674 [Lactococcus termiticola]|uniref:Uncharacterized protein n=2 Tax=Lactococcus termiticola TaxID=2169526 RepID=A0A2R5HJQ4_9LACT|nr:hypothetical protein NtB2_00674 [Lactococcus termiticola]
MLAAAILYFLATSNQNYKALMLASLGPAGSWGANGTLINGGPVVLVGGSNAGLVLFLAALQFLLVWLSFVFFKKGGVWPVIALLLGIFNALWACYEMLSGLAAISGLLLLVASGLMIAAFMLSKTKKSER